MSYKLVTIILYIFIGGCVGATGKSPIVQSKSNNSTSNLGDCDMSCSMEYIFMFEAPGLHECKIILNDSIAIFCTEKKWNQDYLLFTLNNQTANYLKTQFYELYTEHKSAFIDGFTNFMGVLSFTQECSIKVTIGSKRFKEKIDIIGSILSGDELGIYPFNPQFYRIWRLIEAIRSKIGVYFYNEYNSHEKQEAEPWIEEMFHGEYYEPYNNINSNKYQ